ALARGDNCLDDRLLQPRRRVLRSAAAIVQSGDPFRLITLQPFVNGLTSDLIHLRQRRDRFALLVIVNQLDTQVHGSVLLPRHRFLACRFRTQNAQTSMHCNLCPRSKVLPMSPVRNNAEPRPEGAVQRSSFHTNSYTAEPLNEPTRRKRRYFSPIRHTTPAE